MVKLLIASGKYRLMPVKEEISFRADKAPKPKPSASASIPLLPRGRTSSFFADNSGIDDTTMGRVSSHNFPKIPLFSGSDPTPKGEVNYQEWRYEIRCLHGDDEITASTLVQAIRRSLRGTARRMLISLGERPTIADILRKLDTLFGDISTHGMLMQEFFNSSQRQGESVTDFGCRLETLLQTAIDNGSLQQSSKNDMLRDKFWTSLRSEKLKSQTRHKYDSLQDYDELLREIRVVEKEISLSESGVAGKSDTDKQGKKGQSHAVTCEVDQQYASSSNIGKEEQKFKDLEENLLSKLSSVTSNKDEQKSKNSYRGRGRGKDYKGYKGNKGHKNKDQKSDPKE
ncbi:zinc finger CCHC domain-containing protein 12-like [Pecten maximus]|uniref:zinc finger CCHC domain-containing protein 12-like n=1 Tax=Pecten maximus TaxID=6579 RepID=UPI001458613F|nr:zinc finger CCHC domain-containing protein 12-like [Pecten maximus]